MRFKMTGDIARALILPEDVVPYRNEVRIGKRDAQELLHPAMEFFGRDETFFKDACYLGIEKGVVELLEIEGVKKVQDLSGRDRVVEADERIAEVEDDDAVLVSRRKTLILHVNKGPSSRTSRAPARSGRNMPCPSSTRLP